MKLLCFQAERFAWRGHSRTLPDAPEGPFADEARAAVVVFFHAEAKEAAEEEYARVFRGALKHVKWLANKRELRAVVLHSFTHLGGANAEPALARRFAEELAARLEGSGYSVKATPFGWFCSWELAVYGESLAKVWKEL